MKLRLLIAFILVLSFAPAHAQGLKSQSPASQPPDVHTAKTQSSKALDALRKAINNELTGPLFSRCLASVEIADAASGEILVARHEQLLLRPASNTKLVTSAAAVLGLPADFHFETRLTAMDSAMRTIVCVGGGDPMLTGQDIQKLAEIAFNAGVSHVDTLLMDATLYGNDFFGNGWMWDDEADPFTPYLSAFSIDDNTVTVSVRKPNGPNETVQLLTNPASSCFTFEHDASAAGANGFRIDRLPRSNAYRIHGLPPGNSVERERFSIWRPQDVVADLLLRAFVGLGIASDSTVVLFPATRTNGRILGAIRRPLDDVIGEMNKSSNNLCAEATLRALCFGRGKKSEAVGAADGLEAMREILAGHGLGTDGISLADGSGISFYNLISASTLGRLLRLLARHPGFPRYRASLAIGGKDGTLRNRLTSSRIAGEVWAKTGTVRGVSALSGYVQAPGGRLLTVVVFMQNFTGSHAPYREAQDRIMKHCIDYSASIRRVKQLR